MVARIVPPPMILRPSLSVAAPVPPPVPVTVIFPDPVVRLAASLTPRLVAPVLTPPCPVTLIAPDPPAVRVAAAVRLMP